jgi:hypothetical protein
LERELLERELRERDYPRKTPKRDASAQSGIAVTFIVHASRGEAATTTVRLSVAAAVVKGRTLADEGWQVVITGPDGIRYCPPEFDKLLSRNPAAHSRS